MPEQLPQDDEMQPISIPWHQKLLMKFAPRSFFSLFMKKQGIDDAAIDHAYGLFQNKKIHLQPLSGQRGRGFIISLDNKMTLWFFQNGDHFTFDGFEIGEYADGDVTLFDGMTKKSDVLM